MCRVVRAAHGLVWLALFAGLLLGEAQATGVKRALVIGNAAYRVGHLRNVLNDVDLVAGLLRDLGYQVVKETNLDLKGMRQAVRGLADSIRPDDEVFVYFAGHCFELESQNYLMGVSLSPRSHAEVEKGAMPLKWLMRALSKARMKVIVMDGSRPERFTETWRRFDRHGIAGVHPVPENTYLGFSAAPFAVALDSDPAAPNHGPYAMALKARLRQPGPINDVFHWVKVETARRTQGRQVPHQDSNVNVLYGFSDPVVLPRPPGREVRSDALDGQAPDPAVIEWVPIEGGAMEVGDDVEVTQLGPRRVVTVADFELMKTEVTVAQYRRCVEAGACTAPPPRYGDQRWDAPEREAFPVEADWYQAVAFARWAKARLPSGLEWEFAARSRGRFRTNPWGETPATCQHAMMADERGSGCGYGFTSAPVCSKPLGDSEQGICDLVGNVAEWVDGVVPDDPTEPPGLYPDGASNGQRWCRGASYISPAVHQDVRALQTRHATTRLGFRLARTSPGEARPQTK